MGCESASEVVEAAVAEFEGLCEGQDDMDGPLPVLVSASEWLDAVQGQQAAMELLEEQEPVLVLFDSQQGNLSSCCCIEQSRSWVPPQLTGTDGLWSP